MKRVSSVRTLVLIILACMAVFTLIVELQVTPEEMNEYYFQEAFPLVVRGESDYLKDMVFVQPKNSEFFEAYGYSEMYSLLVTIKKDTHETHYYPDVWDNSIFYVLTETEENMDDFLIAWSEGRATIYSDGSEDKSYELAQQYVSY